MRFDRLLNLCLEEFEKEEISGNRVVNKEFAKELGLDGEQITSKELYRVALDIRKHPEDYTGMKFFNDLIMHKYNSNYNSGVAGFPDSFYIEDRNLFITRSSDSWYEYFQQEVNSEFFHKVKNRVMLNSAKQFKRDKSYYEQGLKSFQWENKSQNRIVLPSQTHFYKTNLDNVTQQHKKRTKMLESVDEKFLKTVLQYNYGNKVSPKTEEEYRKYYSMAVGAFTPIVSELKVNSQQVTRAYGESVIDDGETLNFLMTEFSIGSNDVYRFLLKVLYKLPVHPKDIDARLRSLGSEVIDAIYVKGRTPISLAVKSCNERNGGGPSLSFVGDHGILDVSEQDITKKEAYDWLLGLAQQAEYRESKEYIENMKRKAHNAGMDMEDYMNYYNYNTVFLQNFPSYYIIKRSKELGLEEYINGQELSIQDMSVFRWFIRNMGSKYFWKQQQAFGPAGQHRQFLPIEILTHITSEDLVNGVKTSPEIEFSNAGERAAKRHTLDDKIRFNNFDHFKDTEHARVLRSQGDLNREGEALGHCVGGYGQSCKSGRSVIVALPNSTAEIDPKTFRVFQHRGPKNATPDSKDEKYLHEWIKANNPQYPLDLRKLQEFGDHALNA